MATGTETESALPTTAGEDELVPLDPDHPGFRDPVYRARRNAIARIGREAKEGEPPPRVDYTPEEDAVWGELFDRQMKLLAGLACREYLDGVKTLGLKADKVPQLRDVNRRLNETTGFGVEGVPALIPPARFYELLSQGKFPLATFLRRREHIDYIEEPDLFHEVFGHCPLLTNQSYANFVRRFGEAAVSLGKGYSWHLFRVFWFTVEFGLINTPQGRRCFGAGIVSSPSEARAAMEGTACEFRPFDLMTVLRTPYRIDIVQPIYYVIDSFADLEAIVEQDIGAMILKAKALGDFPPAFEAKAS